MTAKRSSLRFSAMAPGFTSGKAVPDIFFFTKSRPLAERQYKCLRQLRACSIFRRIVLLPAGAPHRLGNITGHDATWSRDGQQIVYAKSHGLYLTSADGSESHTVATVEGWPFAIQWSPEERTLRFSQWDTKTDSYSLWEVSSRGNNLHRLLSGWTGQARNECCGNWTHDGKYYIFTSGRGERFDIWGVPKSRDLFAQR